MQYFVLNAYTAVITVFITIIELFIFHKNASDNKKTNVFILVIVELLLICIGIIVEFLWVVYNFIVGAYVSLLGSLFELLARFNRIY